MDTTFSNQFRKYRKKKGFSQEQVAERLCVSAQAVSKWETGVSYPDISLLPIIANLFGVSVDYLLGVNLSEKEEAINAALEECRQLTEQKQYGDAVTILRHTLVRYPSEPRLMYQLAWNLTGTIRETPENLYEAIKIYEKILQLTDDPELYSCVLRDLIYRHYTAGDVKTAKEYAERLLPFKFCKEYILGRSNLLCGKELADYLINNINLYGEAMEECLEYFTDTVILSEEEMRPLTPDAAKKMLDRLNGILASTKEAAAPGEPVL